jgi:hypothetical protein
LHFLNSFHKSVSSRNAKHPLLSSHPLNEIDSSLLPKECKNLNYEKTFRHTQTAFLTADIMRNLRNARYGSFYFAVGHLSAQQLSSKCIINDGTGTFNFYPDKQQNALQNSLANEKAVVVDILSLLVEKTI